MFKLQSTHSADRLRISNYLMPFCDNDEEIYAFTKKVTLEKDIKLKEFNFKLLHGILPCNMNLMRWKIRHYDHCDVCGETQTIEHLLCKCQYVQPLWQVVKNVFDVDITFKCILGLEVAFEHDDVFTIVCFLIYKEWLLLSLENKDRNPVIALEYYKAEFQIISAHCS